MKQSGRTLTPPPPPPPPEINRNTTPNIKATINNYDEHTCTCKVASVLSQPREAILAPHTQSMFGDSSQHCTTHMHARTHARTPARTHTHTQTSYIAQNTPLLSSGMMSAYSLPKTNTGINTGQKLSQRVETRVENETGAQQLRKELAVFSDPTHSRTLRELELS